MRARSALCMNPVPSTNGPRSQEVPERVLVVETDPHTRTRLCEWLEAAGLNVSATGTTIGLLRALKERPAVVVIDLAAAGLDLMRLEPSPAVVGLLPAGLRAITPIAWHRLERPVHRADLIAAVCGALEGATAARPRQPWQSTLNRESEREARWLELPRRQDR